MRSFDVCNDMCMTKVAIEKGLFFYDVLADQIIGVQYDLFWVNVDNRQN